MTRQARPLWQSTRAEITWRALRDLAWAVGWVVATWTVWTRGIR